MNSVRLLIALLVAGQAQSLLIPQRRLTSLRHLRGGQIGEEAADGFEDDDDEADELAEVEDGIHSIATEDELAVLLEEAGSRLVVVDYFADWCGPCKKIAPVFHDLARKAGSKVVFAKVDVDQARELSAAQGVKSMPTIQFFRNGKQTALLASFCPPSLSSPRSRSQVDQIVGADKQRLKELVQRATLHPLLRALTGERLLSAAAVLYVLIFANPLKQSFA
eukprot:5573602-Prymnesium_polylepis.2